MNNRQNNAIKVKSKMNNRQNNAIKVKSKMNNRQSNAIIVKGVNSKIKNKLIFIKHKLKHKKRKKPWFDIYSNLWNSYKLKNNKRDKFIDSIFEYKKREQLRYIKYVKHVFYSKKKKKKENLNLKIGFKLKRYLTFYSVYKDKKNKFISLQNDLKKVKNKKIKKYNIKNYLWNSLTFINKNIINDFYFNTLNLDIKWKQDYVNSVNYYNIFVNKNKYINYKFFYNYHFYGFFKNRLNDNIININIKNNFLNLIKSLRELNDYKIFFKNNELNDFNIFYFYQLYDFIKQGIVSKILYTLKLKNTIYIYIKHFNYIELTHKKYLFSSNFNIVNNTVNVNNNFYALNNLKRETGIWTQYFMRKKKWTKNAMYFWSLPFLKRMLAVYLKINSQFNSASKIKTKKISKRFYNITQSFIFDNNKLKIGKRWQLFYNFIRKSKSFNTAMVSQYHMNFKYNIKKYYDFIYFIKNSLLKLFDNLKYLFFYNNNKLINLAIKLKLIMYLFFYKNYLKVYNIKNWGKRNLKAIAKSAPSYIYKSFKLKYYSNNILKEKLNNKRKVLNKMIIDKRALFKNYKERYKEPFNIFRYDPALNPKHDYKLRKKIIRHKKSDKFFFNYIRRVAYRHRSFLNEYKKKKKKNKYLTFQSFLNFKNRKTRVYRRRLKKFGKSVKKKKYARMLLRKKKLKYNK